MTEEELTAWRKYNNQLQKAYNDYYTSSTQSEKESALRLIEIALEYNPFMNYVINRGGNTTGLVRHGLDLITELSIKEINKIALEE